MENLLGRIGLRFADVQNESRFRAEHDAATLSRQRILIGIALIAFLIYAVRDIALGPTFGYGALYFRLFVILPILGLGFALTYVGAVRGNFHTIFVALLVVVIASLGMLSLLYPHYGPADPAQTNRTMSTMMLIIAIMGLAGLRFEQAVATALLAVVFWFLGSIAKQLQLDLYPTLLLNVLLTFVVGCFASYWIERAGRDAFAARLAVAHERKQSEDIIFAALPRHVVARVGRNERPIAEAFVEAVVVLADLAGFNALSKRIGPRQTVEVLDHIFTLFDTLAEKHHLQRLRTVGDSYVVVGGTFDSLRGGAQEAAQIALDMRDAVAAASKSFGLPIGVRIGVHVGPLIGGVVGRTAPVYDFWGDTFNVVSDLQLICETGRILCSENFYWRAGKAWRFEASGVREFEGVGTIKTFYLAGPTAAPGAQETVDGA